MSLLGKFLHRLAEKNAGQLLSLIILVIPAACVYIPTPDVGHLSGRAAIADDDVETLKAGEGVITRKQVLLMLGDPNERYNRDEYFCYAWERMIGIFLIAAGGPYGPAGVGGALVGKDHWLCMQFSPDARLVHIVHIEPFSDGGDEKNRVLNQWNQSGSGGKLKITYDYYTLDRLKYEIIRAMAVKGIPESQWRLYDEFGKKSDHIVWLCRSADNGYTKAQLEVGHIYWASSNIPKNRIKAFVWYKKATSGDENTGNMNDRTTQDNAIKAIQDAVNTMSLVQLLEAYNYYSKWEKGNCEQELVD